MGRTAKTPRKTPHVAHGTWMRIVDAATGETIGFDGEFKDIEEAKGAIRHLWNAHIMHWKFHHNSMPIPEVRGDTYIVSLRGPEIPFNLYGDNLGEFEKFAREHKIPLLLPKLPKPDTSLAFAPAREEDVERIIDHLPWQAAGDSVAVDIADRKLAFQVAFYLKKHHYIASKQFTRLNNEVKEPEDGLFRLVISSATCDAFCKKFTHAGHGYTPSESWVDALRAQSDLPRVRRP